MIQQLACALMCSALALPAVQDVTQNVTSQDVTSQDAQQRSTIRGSLRGIDLRDSQSEPIIMGPMSHLIDETPVPDFNGSWQLAWDDTLDGSFVDINKACSVDFKVVNGTITGTFLGSVLGTERDAIFTGEVFGGYPALLTFTQREPGYSCTYQVFWSPSESVPVGTWHDTRGASGEFTFLKQQ